MRGHIRARGKGTWAIVIEQERGAGGERRQKWHTVKGTKREAERELTRLLQAMSSGEYVDPQRLSVSDLLDRWLHDDAERRLGPASAIRYEQHVRLHLKPVLGHHRLSALTPLHIQSCYSALLDGSSGSIDPLSALTVRQIHNVLHQALGQAVRWQLLSRNPADHVRLPKATDAAPAVLSREEISSLLAAAAGQPLHTPLILAIATGMRRNEILGLRWSDVDLEAGRLAVQVALVQTKDRLELLPPKTPSSRRPIDLPRFAVEHLRRHKAAQAAQRLQLCAAYQDHGLVVPREDGRPAVPRVLNQRYAKLLRDAGLPAYRFHDLRHTHATLLLQEGVHPKVVSERLGHSRVAVTLDRYSHVLPHMQKEAAERLETALRPTVTE